MAKSIIKTIISITFTMLVLSACSEQTVNNQQKDLTLPDFSFVGLSEPLSDQQNIKVSVHVKIPYTELQFTRVGERFLARYEVSVNISDDNDERIAGAIWSDSLWIDSYQETRKTDETVFSIESFVVPASELSISVRVTDLYTNKSRVLKDEVDQTKMYQGNLALGNIMIMDNYSPKGGDLLMDESFYEVVDTLKFKARLIGKNHPYKLSYELLVKDVSKKKELLILDHTGPIDSLLSFIIPLTDMEYSNYTLFLSAEDGSNNRVTTKAHFRVRIKGINFDIGDMDEAIRQLLYIANDRQIRDLLNSSDTEKAENFKAFWAALDPSPGTNENELMEEYYRRVAYSIQAFTVVQPGWKSDRGMIYILFGPPDEIQRVPFDIERKPYQVWEYFRLGKQFIFWDKSGFGEYVLDSSYHSENDWKFNY
ncbi:MAG: GWxTD domain-containing protein [Candidatus Marinimicrobia bacterium]|nr:GWxTD domain-containing protein [Candidatus Neomarinimicrobiota bacterium]